MKTTNHAATAKKVNSNSEFPDPDVDYRRNPEAYRVGRGETGVLTVEPYKSELLPLWRFKTADAARTSSEAIYAKFISYRDEGDFVGMDMARKFLQMGYTRSRRYARLRSGRKFDVTGEQLPEEQDPEKQRSAELFRIAWDKVRSDEQYQQLKQQHQRRVSHTQAKPQ